jgi:hypothetical protein
MLFDDRCAKTAVLIGALALTALAARGAGAQTISALAGYHLGDTWSRIGRAMPCQTDSLAARLPLKNCSGPNDVKLTFVRDTLCYIGQQDVEVATDFDRSLDAESLWHGRWKQWSLARFGVPDSVTTFSLALAQPT